MWEPTGLVLCSQEHGGDNGTGNLEQACPSCSCARSLPTHHHTRATSYQCDQHSENKGEKYSGSHSIKTRYWGPLCWERVTKLVFKKAFKSERQTFSEGIKGHTVILVTILKTVCDRSSEWDFEQGLPWIERSAFNLLIHHSNCTW